MKPHNDWFQRFVAGSAGGLAGTLAMQPLMAATAHWLPEGTPPLRQDPGEFMVQRAEDKLSRNVRRQIPTAAETATARALAIGYGVTFGALYSAVRPKGGSPLWDGFVLGLACWAAGYLGWLPAMGLMRPVWRQTVPRALTPAAEHVVFGIATVAVYDWLRNRMS
jgi:hypothetical protein